MISIQLTNPGKQIQKTVKTRINEIVRQELDILLKELKAKSPRARGGFANAWEHNFTNFYTEFEIINIAENAEFRLFGRDAGAVPKGINFLKSWARTKNIPESALWAIKRKIAEIGTDRFISGTNPLGLNRDGTYDPGSPFDLFMQRLERRIEAALNVVTN
jgi:hypothetical protein